MLYFSCLRCNVECRGTLWTKRIRMLTSCAFHMHDRHSQGQDHREFLSMYGVTLVPHARPEGMTSAGPKQTPAVMTIGDLAQVASISTSDSSSPLTPFEEPPHWKAIKHCPHVTLVHWHMRRVQGRTQALSTQGKITMLARQTSQAHSGVVHALLEACQGKLLTSQIGNVALLILHTS